MTASFSGGKTSHPSGEEFFLKFLCTFRCDVTCFTRLRASMVENFKMITFGSPEISILRSLRTFASCRDKSRKWAASQPSFSLSSEEQRKVSAVGKEKRRRIKFLLMQAKFVFQAAASAMWLGDTWFMSLFNQNRLLLVSYTRFHLEQTMNRNLFGRFSSRLSL